MDHFPPVLRPHRPLQVPYLGGEYDNKSFEEYPTRHGYNVQQLQAGNVDPETIAATKTFLQTWFYFGMLHQVLGLKIETADFVRTECTGGAYITTARLPKYLHIWRESLSMIPDTDSVAMRNKEITSTWAYSHSIWQGFDKSARDLLIPAQIHSDSCRNTRACRHLGFR